MNLHSFTNDEIMELFQDLEEEFIIRRIKIEYNEIYLKHYNRLQSMICGAMKDAIRMHGPIDLKTLTSASKRIIGVIKQYNQITSKKNFSEK